MYGVTLTPLCTSASCLVLPVLLAATAAEKYEPPRLEYIINWIGLFTVERSIWVQTLSVWLLRVELQQLLCLTALQNSTSVPSLLYRRFNAFCHQSVVVLTVFAYGNTDTRHILPNTTSQCCTGHEYLEIGANFEPTFVTDDRYPVVGSLHSNNPVHSKHCCLLFNTQSVCSLVVGPVTVST